MSSSPSGRLRSLPPQIKGLANRVRRGPNAAVPGLDAVVDGLSHADVVDLGHRLILGRPADPQWRASLLAEMAAGRITPAQAWAAMAGSAEFAGRVQHQREVIDAAEPVMVENMIDVADLRAGKSIPEHNAAAEVYFASQDPITIERMLAKPFDKAHQTTELLTCFGHMVAGLQVLPGETLLDFGAGSGWTSWNFAQLGLKVICSDVAPSALQVARERFARWPLSPGQPEPSFLLFDGHRLDLADDSVDKVCCFDAFHHLINQAEVMAELARVVKPGGLLGFDEPGRHHSKAVEAQFEMREYGVVEGDIDLKEIAAMAADAGLEFVQADVLTIRPIWADLEQFSDLADKRVPNALMLQQLGEQINTKQLFVLRKPGGGGIDSRHRSALGAALALNGEVHTTFHPDGGVRMRIGLTVQNTGTAQWLPADAGTGAVMLGARSTHPERWDGRAHIDRPLDLAPDDRADIEATFELPAAVAGQELAVNLVSENVAWFDICGTPSLTIRIPPPTDQ